MAREGPPLYSACRDSTALTQPVSQACPDSLLERPLYQRSASTEAPLSQLYHSGSAARWRRKGAQQDYFSFSIGTGANKNSAGLGTRLTAVRDRSMEEVHGVDVSWLHKPNKGMAMQGLSESRAAS